MELQCLRGSHSWYLSRAAFQLIIESGIILKWVTCTSELACYSLFSFHSPRLDGIPRFWFNAGFTIKPRFVKSECTHPPQIYERVHTRCDSAFFSLSVSLRSALPHLPPPLFFWPRFFTLWRRVLSSYRSCKLAISKFIIVCEETMNIPTQWVIEV